MASPDSISWRKVICEAVLTRVNLINGKIVIGSFGRVIKPANMVRCILVLVINMIIILWRLWGVFCRRCPLFKFYCLSVFNERCRQTGIQNRICIFYADTRPLNMSLRIKHDRAAANFLFVNMSRDRHKPLIFRDYIGAATNTFLWILMLSFSFLTGTHFNMGVWHRYLIARCTKYNGDISFFIVTNMRQYSWQMNTWML